MARPRDLVRYDGEVDLVTHTAAEKQHEAAAAQPSEIPELRPGKPVRRDRFFKFIGPDFEILVKLERIVRGDRE